MPLPMPTHDHGFWVGMGAMLLFHGWAWVGISFVHPAPNQSQTFMDAANTLTKKRSGLKPTTLKDLLFVRSNQDLV